MRAVGATSSRSVTSRSSAYMFTWTRTTPGPIPLVTRGSTEGSERETGLEASMNTQIETDVLIVGSGPAGGSAALFLSTYGVKNVVLTKYRWTANTPRAHITNQRTMEILRDMGVAAEVVEKSSPQELMSNNVFCTSLVGEELGRLRAWGTHPSRMADYTLASPSRICDCPQTLMEPILLSHAAARGSRVRFDTEYLSLEQDADGVTATVRDRIGGGTYQIRAKYLLGADGARSLVARDIALPMVGQVDVAGSINILVSADLAKYVAYRPGVLYWVLQPGSDIGAGLQHPVEHSWSEGNVFREVGRDEDIYAAGDIHLPDHGQGDVPGDQAASAVSTQQILGPDLIGSAANTVAYRGGHTIGVLLEREVLSVETDPRPTGGGVAEQDRLHQGLRTVADTRRACERIVRHPAWVRAPRTQPSKLLSDQARAEHVIAHKLLGRGLLDDFRRDAHVAQDFHSALVRDVRPRRVRGPAVLGEHHILHAIRAQEERRRPASRAAPNNQDICLDLCVHAYLQSCFSFATFG